MMNIPAIIGNSLTIHQKRIQQIKNGWQIIVCSLHRPPFRRIIRYFVVLLALFLGIFGILSIIFPLRVDVPYSQVITDRDGQIIHTFLSPDDKWRFQATLQEISPQLLETIIQKEDRWFYWHIGLNPVSLVRAFVVNIRQRKIISGASTMTMQVARLLENYHRPGRARTLWHKTVEVFRALQLEARYSKKEILALYCNLIPFGGNIEGIKAASILYFGREPAHLSLAQVVTLTVIPNKPTSLKLEEQNDRIRVERNKWLAVFARNGFVAAREADDALHEPLDIQRREAPKLIPHLAVRLNKEYSGQTSIQSSIHSATQSFVTTIVQNKMQRLRPFGIHNAAVLVLDNRTFEVRAYLGSPDFNDRIHAGEVDAVRAVRSPGSALKPLVYGLALDQGLITPKTRLSDVPINLDGYAPENFDKRYRGFISTEESLVNSLNVPAVKLLQAIGVPRCVEALVRCGFRQVQADKNKLGLSLVLGGCGARLEEMVGLYSMITNGGMYIPPRFAVNTTAQNRDSSRIVSPASAFMLAEMLRQMNRPDVPGKFLTGTSFPLLAWKTGTSYGRRDAWSIGFNTRYTIGVWVGNSSGIGVPELVGADIATPLLFELFSGLDRTSGSGWFVPPANLDFRLVCAESGLAPDEHCENQITDYYIPSVSSNNRCKHLRKVFVSPDKTISYCADCLPVSGYITALYRNIPPEMVAWYQHGDYPFERIPVHNPYCKRLLNNDTGQPTITSLVNGKEYLVEQDSKGQIRTPLLLTCQAGNEVQTVYWFINHRLYSSCTSNKRIFFTPGIGENTITCCDDRGRMSTISITVVGRAY